jgi:two pore calcium channel protein 1
MNTLVVLTPRLISVFFLLLIIYYFFAILGMEVFQGRVSEGCCSNASYNVGDYYAGSQNDTTTNVYYLNNFDDLLRSYVTLFILMVVNNWYIIMEGFASEVPHHWPARIYFMCFYIVTLVVLQVVIAFIVEAFVLQLEQSNRMKDKRKKILERHISVADDSDCVEDEHRKKEVRIVLVSEDIAKLKYVTTYIDERSQNDQFSLNRFVRRTRRKKLPTNTQRDMQYSGRRLRTKDDLHLWNYRADIQQWIEEQDDAFRQVESSVQHRTDPTFKKRLWECSKKVLTYLLE